MSLPRCLTRDFFSILADSISNATEQYFQQLHESKNPIKLLCLQQSRISESKYLIEVLDGSVPVEYKHTCLIMVPPGNDGERQLTGKIISFNQYKISATKHRYLLIITRLTIVPGDYRHLTCHLSPALVYHPGLAVPGAATAVNNAPSATPTNNAKDTIAQGKTSGPMGAIKLDPKHPSGPYESSKPVEKISDMTPMKITDLTIYTPKWLIRARITHKSEIRKYNNQWGEGQLFSIDLCDAHGEIRALFFGEAVNKWYSFLEEGQVYSISGGQLKPANKKFSNINHACEITLDENSQIQLFQNDDSIPSICCNFTKLSELDNVDVGSIIDVIGVVARVKDIQTFVQKSTGSNIEKRDVLLVDSSGTSIWLTLWGPKVQIVKSDQLEWHPLLCLKGVRVGDWQGRKLDTQAATKVTIEPVIPEAIEIRKWWNANSQNYKVEATTSKQETQIGELVSLSHIISAGNQALQFKSLGDKGIVFTTRALVEMIRETSFSWPACPECRKKMTNDNGTWCCQKCAIQRHPLHLYMLQIKLVDGTSQLWASAMTAVGEEIMCGTSAGEAVQLAESGGVDAQGRNLGNVFEEARLSEFIFKIKIFSDTYMDEPKLKFRINKAIPLHKSIDAAIESRLKSIKAAMSSTT